MKTVYIPAGATYNYETLVTDNVIVHGHLHVTNGLKAKHISGRGFITAGEVSADIVDVTELECGTVICRRLLAQRVSVNEAMISENAVISRFFSGFTSSFFSSISISSPPLLIIVLSILG